MTFPQGDKAVEEKKFFPIITPVISFINNNDQNLYLYLFFVFLFINYLPSQTVNNEGW